MKRTGKNGYTQEQIEYLREIGDETGRTNKEIREMFNNRFKTNKTLYAISGVKCRHGIKSYTRQYTGDQIDYLRKISRSYSHKEIIKKFNKKYNDNRTQASIESIMQDKGIKLSNDGRFKKGRKPHNWVPVGSERITKDGYVQVKIQEGKFQKNWKAKHFLIWEEINGPVPSGHVVIFGDGDKTNLDIDNLICVSRAQLLKLNQLDLIKDSTELTETGILIADLHLGIGKRKKEKDG